MQVALYTQDKDLHAVVGKAAAASGHACVSFAQTKATMDSLQKGNCEALIVDGDAGAEASALLAWASGHLPPAFPVIALMPASYDTIAGLLDQHSLTDYLVKPLRQGELALRLRVALQRAYPERFVQAPLVFGSYAFDEGSHRLTFKGRPVDLTLKEFALALLFFRHLDRPLSRAFIVERIWSRDLEVSSRTVDTHVSRVRNKLALKPENGFKLVPVYSFGYRLEQLAK